MAAVFPFIHHGASTQSTFGVGMIIILSIAALVLVGLFVSAFDHWVSVKSCNLCQWIGKRIHGEAEYLIRDLEKRGLSEDALSLRNTLNQIRKADETPEPDIANYA